MFVPLQRDSKANKDETDPFVFSGNAALLLFIGQ